jgi:hypothetical protein
MVGSWLAISACGFREITRKFGRLPFYTLCWFRETVSWVEFRWHCGRRVDWSKYSGHVVRYAIQGKTDKRQSMREEGSTESFSSLPTYDDSHPPDNLEFINSATKKSVLNNALQKILVGKCFAHVAAVETIYSFWRSSTSNTAKRNSLVIQQLKSMKEC